VDDDEAVQRVLQLLRQLENDDVTQMEKTIRRRQRKENVKRPSRFAPRNSVREVNLPVEDAPPNQMWRPKTSH
jgi:hypothetical protein